MDVDTESHDPEDATMDGEDGQRTSKKRKGKKARKSMMDVVITSEQEALAALESNEALYLRLRKKYYTEALAFIRMIESSVECVTQLLGSTNKAEVLEAMEFFKVIYHYEFEGAGVRILFASVCPLLIARRLALSVCYTLSGRKTTTRPRKTERS